MRQLGLDSREILSKPLYAQRESSAGHDLAFLCTQMKRHSSDNIIRLPPPPPPPLN